MCEPVEHFCISVKSGDGIKSGIYSKLKGGYQDQQPQRSDPVLLKILPNTLENLTLAKFHPSLFVVWKEKEQSEVVWGALKSVIAKARKFPREKVIVATGYRQSFTKTSNN